jgi:hypothetical protein
VPLNLCPLKNDQRGITRPQGAHCDAGSYEFAPPTIASLRAAGRSATTGTATAQINPNFSSQDTIVNVKYGTTPAYGSSTTAQEIGRGDTAVSFHATLSGLKPGATYYVEIAATNADGTSTATGGKFTTRSVGTGGTPGSKPGKPGLHAKINHKHHTAKFTFSDSNATGFQCALVKSKRHSKKKPPKPRYSACRSPKTYKHLSRGRYQFFVRGTDTAGAGVAASFKFSF